VRSLFTLHFALFVSPPPLNIINDEQPIAKPPRDRNPGTAAGEHHLRWAADPWPEHRRVLRVKKSHQEPSLGVPVIVLDARWTDWLAVWVWVIEHPEGLLVVDTGETPAVLTDAHWEGSGEMGAVNRQIIRFGQAPTLGLGAQLKALGLQPNNVRWVAQTHLHIDHTDGLRDVPHAEVLVSRTEWQKPYGAVPSTWPQGFRPHQVDHAAWPQATQLGALGVCAPLTQDGRLWLVPTPGHTPGHQSLLLRGGTGPDGTLWPDILFAGDLAFTQDQLLAGQIPGITANKELAAQ